MGAEAFQREVARHLSEEVTDKEQSGSPAIDRGGEREVLVHGQRGETDIDPVEIAQEVHQNDDGQESPSYFADGLPSDCLVHGVAPQLFIGLLSSEAGRRCISAVRTQFATSVPVWLKALCLNVTIPAFGREPLGRVASTVVTT